MLVVCFFWWGCGGFVFWGFYVGYKFLWLCWLYWECDDNGIVWVGLFVSESYCILFCMGDLWVFIVCKCLYCFLWLCGFLMMKFDYFSLLMNIYKFWVFVIVLFKWVGLWGVEVKLEFGFDLVERRLVVGEDNLDEL